MSLVAHSALTQVVTRTTAGGARRYDARWRIETKVKPKTFQRRRARDRFLTATAKQVHAVEEATANLREAVELFPESASPEEIKQRLHTDVFVTRFEAAHG